MPRQKAKVGVVNLQLSMDTDGTRRVSGIGLRGNFFGNTPHFTGYLDPEPRDRRTIRINPHRRQDAGLVTAQPCRKHFDKNLRSDDLHFCMSLCTHRKASAGVPCSFPTSGVKLEQLTFLCLCDNGLTGMPTQLTQCVSLHVLLMEGNHLVSLGDRILEKLPQLRVLSLRRNNILHLNHTISQLQRNHMLSHLLLERNPCLQSLRARSYIIYSLPMVSVLNRRSVHSGERFSAQREFANKKQVSYHQKVEVADPLDSARCSPTECYAAPKQEGEYLYKVLHHKPYDFTANSRAAHVALKRSTLNTSSDGRLQLAEMHRDRRHQILCHRQPFLPPLTSGSGITLTAKEQKSGKSVASKSSAYVGTEEGKPVSSCTGCVSVVRVKKPLTPHRSHRIVEDTSLPVCAAALTPTGDETKHGGEARQDDPGQDQEEMSHEDAMFDQFLESMDLCIPDESERDLDSGMA